MTGAGVGASSSSPPPSAKAAPPPSKAAPPNTSNGDTPTDPTERPAAEIAVSDKKTSPPTIATSSAANTTVSPFASVISTLPSARVVISCTSAISLAALKPSGTVSTSAS